MPQLDQAQFEKRMSLFVKLLFAANFFDIFFYSPEKSALDNTLNLALGFLLGMVTTWGIYKRKNWGRVLLHIVLLLGASSYLMIHTLNTAQIVVLTATNLLFAYVLFFLYRNKEQAMAYFNYKPARIGVKVVWGILAFCGVGMLAALVIFGRYIEQSGKEAADSIRKNLITEGKVNPDQFATCEAKFAEKVAGAENLARFCRCFVLNINSIKGIENLQKGETMPISMEFLSGSVALTQVCLEGLPKAGENPAANP